MPDGGLPISRLIDISIALAPAAIPFENFQSLMLVGDTPGIIDTYERFRTYAGIAEVAGDFPTTTPEYLAALLFFSQVPEPDTLNIGFWAHAATSGRLVGGVLSGTQQAMSNWTSITDGSFRITIDGGVATHGTNTGAALTTAERLIGNWNVINDGAFTVSLNGVAHNVTGLDLTGVFFLDDVATIVAAALNGFLAGSTCTWNGLTNRFTITSGTTGAASTVSYLTTEGTGTDISGMLKARTAQGTLVDGVNAGGVSNITALNFSAATNLNGVASTIQTALNAAVAGTTCVWDGTNDRFVITSPTTGTSSTISFLSATGGGTDISAQLLGTSALASWDVDGIAAETAIAAVVALDELPGQWYALNFAAGAANGDISDADHLAIAAYVEASGISSGNPHIYGLTTAESSALILNNTTDIGSECVAAGYERTFGQYSGENPYASVSMFGRLLTVDFQAQNSTLTLMWKVEPGVISEASLSTSAANSLDAKRYNYYANYRLGGSTPAVLTNGMMFGPAFIDEIFNLDAFANQLQTDLFNLMYTTTTKIPQTDYGVHQLVTACNAACDAFVNNGFLAPGVWNSTGFGILERGDTVSKGYYVYAPKVAVQPQADRERRVSPTIQIAGKEAGAIHDVRVSVIINR